MSDLKLLPCPFCRKEIDMEENMYIPERDWKPTFYDPDSGGDPINIHCKCGLEFSTGTYDYIEFVSAWNTRKPIDDIRNKAIDDFFEALQEFEDDDMWLRLKISSIYEIAEQLKARSDEE